MNGLKHVLQTLNICCPIQGSFFELVGVTFYIFIYLIVSPPAVLIQVQLVTKNLSDFFG